MKEFDIYLEGLKAYADQARAEKMEAYLKDQFECLGVMAPERRKLTQAFFNGFRFNHDQLLEFVELSWNCPYREMQQDAIEIIRKHIKLLSFDDLPYVETMIVRKSWWDTIDGIASNIVGPIVKKDEKRKLEWINKWSLSDNMWLKRVAILHQLKYRDDLDTQILEMTIDRAKGTKEFFLNKAIGWMLRQYGKFNPGYVKEYVASHELHPLSVREALKGIG